MKRIVTPVTAIATLALIAVAAIAAATGGTSSARTMSPSSGTGYGAAASGPIANASVAPAINVRRTSHGRTLVDAHGRALYLFEADKANMSNCSGSCASVWPPLTAKATPRARGGAVAAKIGTIRLRGGGRQVTYAGHPLYRYVLDHKPGDTNGQGLNQFGAKWYLLAPSGRKIDDD
jgi:predicted lipoprotein with Yx(FWY)xxD motif